VVDFFANPACPFRGLFAKIIESSVLDSPQGVVAPTPPTRSRRGLLAVRRSYTGMVAILIAPSMKGFTMTPVFAFGMSPVTMVGLLLVGVLLFGRRLPEIGKYLGKGLVEFKKGLKGLEDEVDISSHAAPRIDANQLEAPRPPQRVTTTAPKFEDNAGAITTPPKAE
jgi:sec-independent protein translocase protein TatA